MQGKLLFLEYFTWLLKSILQTLYRHFFRVLLKHTKSVITLMLISSSLARSSPDKFDRELEKHFDNHIISVVFMYLA